MKLSWTQYHQLVHKLALEIKKSGEDRCPYLGSTSLDIYDKNGICKTCDGTGYISKYKAIYSPDNPMLAFLLSKELSLKFIDCTRMIDSSGNLFFHYDGIEYGDKEVLIVSDIINTGKTREQYKDFDFASLYYKYKRFYNGGTEDIRTDIVYIKEIDKDTKVVMPWEVK